MKNYYALRCAARHSSAWRALAEPFFVVLYLAAACGFVRWIAHGEEIHPDTVTFGAQKP